MKIACIGGGPAGLYFSILMKKAFPESRITVHERNKPDDTFGWGVVFSDETLEGFERADAESFAAIRRSFVYWTDIENHYARASVRSTGHGFCGLSRKRLLQILHARARDVGVELRFETEVKDDAQLGPVDLVLASDGINSLVREKHAAHFRPELDWRRCKFAWFGTTKPLEAFTFVFEESSHGLFQVHAYPFQRSSGPGSEPTLSTWIVECHEDTWKRAGLDRASEAESVAYVQALFRAHLDGHPVLTNRSLWRTFPTVRCERWHHGNVVLIGDAAHTAHFSIGSGTKLAMEDAIQLVDAFRAVGTRDVPRALELYEERRRPEVIRLQRAAQTSLEWFENSPRYLRQPPLEFMFNLMTRSKRITYDNLKRRDPELVRRVTEGFAERAGVPRDSTGKAPVPLFAPLRLREVELANRIVVSPMCMYSAVDGTVGDWHFVHLGSRAVGGAGLVFTEMTDVTPTGRITLGCAGLWNDEHERAFARIVDFVHGHSRAKIGIQLAHAGRKGSCNLPWEGDDPLRGATAWTTLAPSALPFAPGWPEPRAMTRGDMDVVRDAFVSAARRADRAGFDVLELHMAHGYLLSSFLSPVSNVRTDEYGGLLEKRLRFPLEVFEAVRAAWPAEKPLSVRVSASDWLRSGGQTIEDTVEIVRALRARGLDLVDVSSAGNTPESRVDYGRMYQVPFADRIRHEVGMPVMAVGGIQGADHANTVLAAGRADLCAIARGHLSNPYLTLAAGVEYEHVDLTWPKQYLAVRPRPRNRP
jgi:anthraniloyl-CoA monooxygenase